MTQVLDRYKKWADRVEKAEADTGGWRPPAGNYRCALTAINISDRKWRYRKPSTGELDAIGVQFSYTIKDEGENFDTPWRGALVVMPTVEESVLTDKFGPEPQPDPGSKAKGPGEGQWKRIQIQESRFKGVLATLVGKPGPELTNIIAELQLIIQDIEARQTAGKDPIFVDVQVFVDEKKEFDGEKILRVVKA